MGWFESFRTKQAIGRDGKPIPWITYPCLSFLEERVNSSMKVFEYGSGNSTLWWASRVQRVVSCEHDHSWYDEVIKTVPRNVELHHIPLECGGAYSKQVSKFHHEFDIIFIDGRDRVNCIKQSLGGLKPNGVVILDNSEVSEYSEGLQFLLSNTYKFLHFSGPGPINFAVWRTTIFYKQDNCLKI
jgi:methyltransferase family protein